MEKELEDFLAHVLQGLGIVVGTAFIGGWLGKLVAALGTQLFAIGSTSITWAFIIGAGASSMLYAYIKKQM